MQHPYEIGVPVGGIKSIEEGILALFRELRNDDYKNNNTVRDENNLKSDMLSDMSYLMSDRGISEITGSTQHEYFHRKWDKIIQSGMGHDDLTFLNPMASRMLPPRDDLGLQTVNRLKSILVKKY